MKKSTKEISVVLSFLCGFVLILVATNPFKMPIIFLTIPFIILAILTYKITLMIAGPLEMADMKKRFLALTISGTIILSMLLQSIRQLEIKDMIIIFVLFVVATFYVKKFEI